MCIWSSLDCLHSNVLWHRCDFQCENTSTIHNCYDALIDLGCEWSLPHLLWCWHYKNARPIQRYASLQYRPHVVSQSCLLVPLWQCHAFRSLLHITYNTSCTWTYLFSHGHLNPGCIYCKPHCWVGTRRNNRAQSPEADIGSIVIIIILAAQWDCWIDKVYVKMHFCCFSFCGWNTFQLRVCGSCTSLRLWSSTELRSAMAVFGLVTGYSVYSNGSSGMSGWALWTGLFWRNLRSHWIAVANLFPQVWHSTSQKHHCAWPCCSPPTPEAWLPVWRGRLPACWWLKPPWDPCEKPRESSLSSQLVEEWQKMGTKASKQIMILINSRWQDPQSEAWIGLQGSCLELSDGQTRRDTPRSGARH